MYLCRELTEHTYPHIGAAFNDRDHTTVIYAVNKISKEVKKDESLRKAVEQIKESIYNNGAVSAFYYVYQVYMLYISLL